MDMHAQSIAPDSCRRTSDRVTTACGSQKLSSGWFTGRSNKASGSRGLARTLPCTHAPFQCRGASRKLRWRS